MMNMLLGLIKKLRRSFARTKKERRGFTILELLVALSVFILISTLVATIFVHAMRMYRETVAFSSALDSAGQVLEQMAREIRTGYAFKTDGFPSNELLFTNARGEDVGYRLVENYIGRCKNDCLDVAPEEEKEFFRPMHSDDLAVDNLMFFAAGLEADDGFPPLVVITLRVVGSQGAVVDLQTTVSARNIGG